MTRYAIRRQDGRFLTRAIHQGDLLWIWLDTPAPDTTFETMTAAYLAIWGSEGPDIGASDPWHVILVAGSAVPA